MSTEQSIRCLHTMEALEHVGCMNPWNFGWFFFPLCSEYQFILFCGIAITSKISYMLQWCWSRALIQLPIKLLETYSQKNRGNLVSSTWCIKANTSLKAIHSLHFTWLIYPEQKIMELNSFTYILTFHNLSFLRKNI